MSTFMVGVFDETFGENVYVEGMTQVIPTYADAKATTCKVVDSLVQALLSTDRIEDMKVRTLPVAGDNPYTVVLEWNVVGDELAYAYVVRTLPMKTRPQF